MPSLDKPRLAHVRLSGSCPDREPLGPDIDREKIKVLSGREPDKISCDQAPAHLEDTLSGLSFPFLILVAIRGGIVLVQTVAQFAIICIALRDTTPEHRPPILRALSGGSRGRKRSSPFTRSRRYDSAA